MNTFQEQTLNNRKGDAVHSLKLLSLDPGETTGVAVFQGLVLSDALQLPTGLMPLAAQTVYHYILKIDPKVVVMEDYKVYAWKANQHKWAELHTPKLIGAIQFACAELGIPLFLQSAQTGKGFCTDERLKEWGFYRAAHRHANDAIRHACQWLMFGKE